MMNSAETRTTFLGSSVGMARKSKLRRTKQSPPTSAGASATDGRANNMSTASAAATTPSSSHKKRDPIAAGGVSRTVTVGDDSSTSSHHRPVDSDEDDAYLNGGHASLEDDDDGGNDHRDGYHRERASSAAVNDDPSSPPPFLPLEEQNQTQAGRRRRKAKSGGISSSFALLRFAPTLKQAVSLVMAFLIGAVLWDALVTPPEERWLRPEASLALLGWVQRHPLLGLFWITAGIAACVVVMVPLGTPLTVGCGYVYKGAYGWKLGVLVATVVSMGGSCLGAVVCFLLGRYLMRDTVKKWVRKYPLFDAIDVAAAEHGLKIMMMLYLTPVLPLGPVSYMCGTTSMPLSSFVIAKIAALPLMLLYVFIGASMGTLLGGGGGSGGGAGSPAAAAAAAVEVQQIEENEYLIASGILLSVVMITCITRQVKRELNKILERQQKLKPGETEQLSPLSGPDVESALEMGTTKRRRG